MASVYLREGSANYVAQWAVYDPAAAKWKTRRASTRCDSRAAAMEVAEEWQRNADAAAAAAGAARRAAPPARQGPRLSPREAEILAAAMERDPSRDPRRKAGRWREFAEETVSGQGDEATRKNYRLCIARWEAFCMDRGQPLEFVEDADAATAEAWRDALLEEGLAARRVNFHLMAVGLVCRRAHRLGLAPNDPFAAVRRVPVSPTKDNLPARPFTDEEVERLALAPYKVAAEAGSRDRWQPGMAEEWETLIRLTATTGQRLSDALALEWAALDLETGVLDYLPRKTRRTSRRIAFPLRYWPETLAMLRRWEAATRTEGDYVFPLLARTTQVPEGQASAPTRWASRAFGRIVEAAGIEREIAREAPETGRGRTRRAVGFHSLRHTANTRCAAAGVPAEVRKELFGHATVEMNRVYTHWDAGVLDAILGKSDK